jgi:hypothetical protein
MNSYIAAYGMKSNQVYRERFELHQAQLQMFTERLSFLTENIPRLFEAHEEEEFRVRFKAIFLYSTCASNYIIRVDYFVSHVIKI